jgi:ornithine cyclodeaminase
MNHFNIFEPKQSDLLKDKNNNKENVVKLVDDCDKLKIEAVRELESNRLAELDKWKLLDFNYDINKVDFYKSDNKIVIICGCGRSGTTLLRVILDTHSQIAAGPESLLFLPLKESIKELSKKFGLNEEQLQKTHDSCKTRSEFIDVFKNLYLSQVKKSIWADKTSRNVHRLGYIFEHFPNAKIIHVIRDGRDVITSLKTHRKRRVSDGKLLPTGYVMPLQDCIDRWLLAMKDASSFRGNTNYMEVKYEDIVLNTTHILEKICSFIGIKFEAKMLYYYEVDSLSRDPLNFPQNVEATRPISSQSIGRWKKDLDEVEIKQIVNQIAQQMECLGYSINSSEFNIERKNFISIPIIDGPLIERILDNDIQFVKNHVYLAFRSIYDRVNDISQPAKFYLQKKAASSTDRIIAMPFYVESDGGVAGIKWIGSNEKNHNKFINRANSIVILNDIETNAPICIMDDSVISSFRTVAVTLIIIERLMPNTRNVACIGMGKLGRLHANILPKIFPNIEKIFCFSDNAKFDDLLSDKIIKCDRWIEAISKAEIIITTTTANEPYIKADDIDGNKLIINISLMDFHLDVFLKASTLIVDDWFQCTQAKKVFKIGVDKGVIKRENVIELPQLLFGDQKHSSFQGIIMANVLGMAIEDIFVAKEIYQKVMFMSNSKPKYFQIDNRIDLFK